MDLLDGVIRGLDQLISGDAVYSNGFGPAALRHLLDTAQSPLWRRFDLPARDVPHCGLVHEGVPLGCRQQVVHRLYDCV